MFLPQLFMGSLLAAGALPASYRLERVFEALSFQQPVLALQAPKEPSRWYVLEQAGRVRVFDNRAEVASSRIALDLTGKVRSGGEMGLLGMAFSPDFAQNGRVYLSYTTGRAPLRSVLSAFVSRDGGSSIDPKSEEVVLTLVQPYENHNGGHVLFGPDGFLYFGLGDGGAAGDPHDNAQKKNNLLGSILRLDVREKPYGIPSDNPFAKSPRCSSGEGPRSCPELFAWGLRNPWRFSFDRNTGQLWAGDVGQNRWEEIDVIVRGGNYGWRVREGAHCFFPPALCGTKAGGEPLIDPVAEYDRKAGNSVTGGYVYRGRALPGLLGHYVFGDFGSGRLFVHEPESKAAEPVELLDSSLNISSFAEDVDGELYVVDYGGGLYRLVSAAKAPSP